MHHSFVAPEREDLSQLVGSGKITVGQLAAAKEAAERAHIKTAIRLLDGGLVSEMDVAEARGAGWGIPAIDLTKTELDEELIRKRAWPQYIERGWIPVRWGAEGRLIVATFVEPQASPNARRCRSRVAPSGTHRRQSSG